MSLPVQIIGISVAMIVICVVFVALGGLFGYITSEHFSFRHHQTICPPQNRGIQRYMRTLELRADTAKLSEGDKEPELTFDLIHIDLPLHEDVMRAVGHDDDKPVWCETHRLSVATKSQAVAWIRENIGPCDNDGRLELLTFGHPLPQRKEQYERSLSDKEVQLS